MTLALGWQEDASAARQVCQCWEFVCLLSMIAGYSQAWRFEGIVVVPRLDGGRAMGLEAQPGMVEA
jgi:hypothetical protein